MWLEYSLRPICRNEIQAGQEIMVMPCKHVGHPVCLEQFFAYNHLCPWRRQPAVKQPRKDEEKRIEMSEGAQALLAREQ